MDSVRSSHGDTDILFLASKPSPFSALANTKVPQETRPRPTIANPRPTSSRKTLGENIDGSCSMEGVGKFFDSVGSIFKGGDNLPWCDPDIIAGCEREVAEAGNEEQKNESLMRLAWALVHSRQPDDVNRGIGMLEASLENSNSPLQTREKIYLLAVGSYRTANYSKSRHLLDRCLEVAPDWRQAQNLSKLVDDQVSRDGMIGMGIVAGAFGVGGLAIAGIVAAATSATRKSTEKK